MRKLLTMSKYMYKWGVGLSVVILAAAIVFVNIADDTTNARGDKLKEIIKVERCLPQNEVCSLNIGGKIISMKIENNVYYLKPFFVSIYAKNDDVFTVKAMYMDFKMPSMDMGVNRITINKNTSKDNIKYWYGKAILPVCVTGKNDWILELGIVSDNIIYKHHFPLKVKRMNK